jgi:hypothetical protein
VPPSKRVLVLLAAVVGLAVAVVAAIAFLTREPPAGAAVSAAAATPEPPGPGGADGAPRPAAPPPPGVLPPSPPPAVQPRPPVAAALRDPWDTVPVLGRSRVGFGRDLETAVAELEPEVAPCFDPDVHARFGALGVREYGGQDGSGETDTASLMLELEATPGGVRIAGAPVESRGRLDEEILACAQHTLEGKRLPVEGAKPGERFKLRFAVAR